jgi:hypothetical protein
MVFPLNDTLSWLALATYLILLEISNKGTGTLGIVMDESSEKSIRSNFSEPVDTMPIRAIHVVFVCVLI